MTTAAELRAIIEGNPRRGIVKRPKKKLPKVALQAFADIADAESEGDRKVAAAFKRTKSAYEAYLKDATGEAWRVRAGEDLLSMSGPKGQAIDIYWDWDAMFDKAEITVEGPGRKVTKKQLSLAALTKQGGKAAATELLLKNLGEHIEEYVGHTLAEDNMDLADELRGIISEKRTAKTYYDLEKGDRAFGGLITDIDPGRGAGRTFSVEYPDRVEKINITNPGQRISSKDRKGMKLREAKKGHGAGRAQAQAKHAWSRKEKKGYTKGKVRRSKKKEIQRQLRSEDIEGALQTLLDEGVEDFAELLERGDKRMVRPAKVMHSAAQNVAKLAVRLSVWAGKAESAAGGRGSVSLNELQATAREMDLAHRALRGAIIRLITAAGISEDLEERAQFVMPQSPEDRAVKAMDPKFRAYMKSLTGKSTPSYHDILKALVAQGLDRKTAGQYAMFATDKFTEAAQYDDLSTNEDGVRAPDPGRPSITPNFDGDHEGIPDEAAIGGAEVGQQRWPVTEGCDPDCDCEKCKAKDDDDDDDDDDSKDESLAAELRAIIGA